MKDNISQHSHIFAVDKVECCIGYKLWQVIIDSVTKFSAFNFQSVYTYIRSLRLL